MIDESGVLSRPETIELIKHKLYFCSGEPPKKQTHHQNWIPFLLDETFIYTSFFADFGPLDLGLTMKFCQQFEKVFTTAQEQMKAVVFFTGPGEQKRSNCAVLILAFLILVLNYSVEQAYGPFIGIQPAFVTFRDAGFCISTFPITVLDQAKAIHKAKVLNHIHYKTFSIQNYQYLQKLQNGDISWIIPGKFIGFSGPVSKRRQISPGVYTLSPEQYIPIMKNLGVTCIIRFNDKCYDRRVFLNNGIRHVDLFYEDGGNPTEGILQSFLQVCEQERGAIAVHCKAGLGRTGTNIAAYMMKHYGYTAKEAIAWCRICRPGSIVGPQQQFLLSIEQKMFQEGQIYREKSLSSTRAGGGLISPATISTTGSGMTDGAEGSGRTTPNIFQKDGGTGGGGGSRRGSRSGQENINHNTTNNNNNNSNSSNSHNYSEGLPPRAHSTGHTRPSSSSSPTMTTTINAVVAAGKGQSGKSLPQPQQQQQYRKELAISSSSRDSTEALSISLDSHQSHEGRPRSSSNSARPTTPSAAASASSSSFAAFAHSKVRTSATSLAINTASVAANSSNNNNADTTTTNVLYASKGINSAPKPQSATTYRSNHQYPLFGLESEVRRSLPLTTSPKTTTATHEANTEKTALLPLSRKDSKQAWNEKADPSSPTMASPTTTAATASSFKYTRHPASSPTSVAAVLSPSATQSNHSTSNGSMPPIERPRSSTGLRNRSSSEFHATSNSNSSNNNNSRRVIATRV